MTLDEYAQQLTIIDQWYAHFVTLSTQSPFVAGVLVAWFLGVSTYLLRNVPASVFHFIRRQTTVTLTINNAGFDGSDERFALFTKWYMGTYAAKFSKSYTMVTNWDAEDNAQYSIAAGTGFHLLYLKGLFGWFKISHLDSSGSEREKLALKITIFGFTTEKLLQVINEFQTKPPSDTVCIREWSTNQNTWRKSLYVPTRNLDTVILPEVLLTQICDTIDEYLLSRDWYLSRGLPYKLVFIFYGPPGTGKSSLIRALATKYRRDVCRIKHGQLTTNNIETCFSTASKHLLVMEDFDSINALKARKNIDSENVVTNNIIHAPNRMDADMDDDTFMGNVIAAQLSLSDFLNALDGIVALDGNIIILTTNDLDAIDGGVYRPGRVDHCLYLGRLETPDIRRYIETMYHDIITEQDIALLSACEFSPMLGSELYKAFHANKYSVQDFISTITSPME